jgi:hypothetical protein
METRLGYSTFFAIRIIAYDKPFGSCSTLLLTTLLREWRDEVPENFKNLSEKRDLIQCTGGTRAETMDIVHADGWTRSGADVILDSRRIRQTEFRLPVNCVRKV